MPVGKRLSKDEPLTEHDVAERLEKAALRVVRIMHDVGQIEGLREAVKASRYSYGALGMLAHELNEWGIEPFWPPEDRAAANRAAADTADGEDPATAT